jgi:hypothetical protein
MFRMIINTLRMPVCIYDKLSQLDCRPAVLWILQGCASAAAACIYCSPYYPLPEDLVLLDQRDRDGDVQDTMLRPDAQKG